MINRTEPSGTPPTSTVTVIGSGRAGRVTGAAGTASGPDVVTLDLPYPVTICPADLVR